MEVYRINVKWEERKKWDKYGENSISNGYTGVFHIILTTLL